MHTLLMQREAAALLRLSERTLERWRVSGDGPPFVKAGRRVGYREADLVAWISARVRTSTSVRTLSDPTSSAPSSLQSSQEPAF
jgi:predicted DNA-binding transcriptional regulator AlpA